jgi:hypothetical protein
MQMAVPEASLQLASGAHTIVGSAPHHETQT